MEICAHIHRQKNLYYLDKVADVGRLRLRLVVAAGLLWLLLHRVRLRGGPAAQRFGIPLLSAGHVLNKPAVNKGSLPVKEGERRKTRGKNDFKVYNFCDNKINFFFII